MLPNKRKRVGKGIVWLAAIISIALLFTACGKSNQVVATYKGGQVTQTDFDKFIAVNSFFEPIIGAMAHDPTIQNYLLEQLVANRTLASQADTNVKSEADQKLQQQWDEMLRITAEQGGKEQMDQELKQLKITENDLKEFMRESYYAIGSMEAKVDDQQTKAAYDEQLQEDPNAFQVATVRHILVGITDPMTGQEIRSKEDALKRAQEVKGKLESAEDWNTLAKDYSDDPGSKEKGGMYADEYVSIWTPAFKQAVLELPLNQISDPVETDFGYHVIKVENRYAKSYDELKESLRRQVAQEMVYEYTSKEVPPLIEKNNLPKPQEAPPATQ